jgi:hypothetical protein
MVSFIRLFMGKNIPHLRLKYSLIRFVRDASFCPQIYTDLHKLSRSKVGSLTDQDVSEARGTNPQLQNCNTVQQRRQNLSIQQAEGRSTVKRSGTFNLMCAIPPVYIKWYRSQYKAVIKQWSLDDNTMISASAEDDSQGKDYSFHMLLGC